MRHPIKIILSFFLLLYSANSYAQYFTIKGRQFYDETGQPFTPVAMTYMLYLTHNGPPNPTPSDIDLQNDFYLSPNNHYGDVQQFECNNVAACTTEIAEDIQKIKDLGFNTIRMTFRTSWNTNGSLQDDKFYVRSFENCSPDPIDDCWNDNDFVEITKDPVTLYANDPVINYLITQMDIIINIITSPPLNMKIMLEIGTGGSKIDPQSSHVNDYIDLLQHVASHYSTNTSLISYNTASEPVYSEDNYVVKNKVCDWTTQWYDAIKDLSADPNHLISTHGDIEDIIYWDPSVSKADYYEIHPYPNLKDYEKTTLGYDEAQASIDRFKGRMFWYRNYCPKPVMIGETGFRASDFSNLLYQAQYPGVLQDPLYYDGTIAEQLDYGTQTFQNAFDCECMGFNWWGYQDDWNWKEVGYALIHHGAIPSSPPDLHDKDVAAVFSTLPTPAINNCTPPSNYLDPENCKLFNPTKNNAITGTLKDNNGNFIKGGVLQALNWLETDLGDPLDSLDDEYIHTWLYDYAEDNGDFEIIPYNYTNIGDDRIIYVRGSAPGAEKFETPEWIPPYGWTDIQITPTNLLPSLTTLNRVNFGYDGTFDGETILQTEQKDLKGWNSVTVNNTTIDGTSDITAREEININSEFHASNTSEVHIFPSDAFIECGIITTFTRLASNNSPIPPETEQSSALKKIEINFTKNLPPDFLITPNPSNGNFQLEILNSAEVITTITIKSILGNELQKFQSSEQNISLDLHNLPKGIYLVEVMIVNKKIVKKLIIN